MTIIKVFFTFLGLTILGVGIASLVVVFIYDAGNSPLLKSMGMIAGGSLFVSACIHSK
jgi:hypothetical protein